MIKRGINAKGQLIKQVDLPTKPIHAKLIKASLWLLSPQIFAPIINMFSIKIVILCAISLFLTFVSIMASKYPTNSYARNLSIKIDNIALSESVELFSTLGAISGIIIIIAFYGMAFVSNLQL